MFKILSGQWLTQIFDRALSLGLIWGFSGESVATKSSLFIAIGALPHVLFSALSAKAITQFGHRKVMLLTEALRFVLLVAFYFVYQLKQLSFFEGYFVFILAFLLNTFAAFYNTAVLSSPRYFVEESQVEKSTSLINTGFSISSVVGPFLFALLFSWGIPSLLVAAAFSYLVSAAFIYSLKESSVPHLEESSSESKILSLPQFILSLLVLFALMNLFLGPLQIFIPLFAKESHVGIGDYARFEFLLAIGLLLGSLAAMLKKINNIQNKNKLLIFLFWVLALSYLVFCQVHQSPWIYVSLFSMGMSLGLANVLLLSYFQMAVSIAAIPALMAAVNLISTASLPLSMSMAAFTLKYVNLSRFAVICAGFFIFVVLLFQLRFSSSGGFKRGNP